MAEFITVASVEAFAPAAIALLIAHYLPHEKRPALSRLPSDDSLYRCSGFVFSTLMAEIAQLSVLPVDGNCR